MAREMPCPICGAERGYAVAGYDRKAGPEVFRFLGLPGPVSRWTVCAGCGFLFQNPRPGPDDILALYASGVYRESRQYTEHFFRMRYRNPVEHFAWLGRRVRLDRSPRVLDIGAGHGGAVRAFRDLGARADGIEVDTNLCRTASHRFGVGLIHGDFATHPFEDAAFDVVYSSHTHEHFDDVFGVNAKIRRLLGPGGLLLLVVPTYRFGGRNGQGFINVFHNSIFTAISLRNMLALSGFEPVSVRYPFDHSRPEVWAVGRKADLPAPAIRRDRPRWVVREIRYAPLLFEGLYRLTDLPARALRSCWRRAGARARTAGVPSP